MGTVALDTANMLLVDIIIANMVIEGWTVLESNFVTGTDREYIMHSTGVSGDKDIYVGFETYQSLGNDYYNISLTYFTGYVNGNTFDTQPGKMTKSMCAHNIDLYYWLFVSKDYVNIGLDIASNACFDAGMVGLMSPYATPGEYPYPIMVFGTLNEKPATRYSTTHYIGLRGRIASSSYDNFSIRMIDGEDYEDAVVYPYYSEFIGDSAATQSGPAENLDLRDTEGEYHLVPLIIIRQQVDTYGEIEGFFFISGFNNVAGNTLTVDGFNYIVLRDTTRTDFDDYLAMRIT